MTSHTTVGNVIVADDAVPATYYETTEHADKELVVVDAKDLHVWYRGTYYIGAGTAETVNKGDVFYYPAGLAGDSSPLIAVVKDIEDAEPHNRVFFEQFDGPIPEGSLLGEPVNMAQMPPPTLLKQQHSY